MFLRTMAYACWSLISYLVTLKFVGTYELPKRSMLLMTLPMAWEWVAIPLLFGGHVTALAWKLCFAMTAVGLIEVALIARALPLKKRVTRLEFKSSSFD